MPPIGLELTGYGQKFAIYRAARIFSGASKPEDVSGGQPAKRSRCK